MVSSAVEVFEERLVKIKEVDDGKDSVIEDLLNVVKKLERGLAVKQSHLERDQVTIEAYQEKHSIVENQLKRLVDAIDSNGFVSVLIDGDSMPFIDRLVRSTKDGGMQAARLLKREVQMCVPKELARFEIRVRVYANIKGLASTYCTNKILDGSAEFNAFVRGFNMPNPMSDFVDAGDGKDCADKKLEEWFKHNVADVQCKAIFFGGSADNGHARLLQPYVMADGSSKNRRIFLIEGPPFAKELAELKDKFLGARFPNVFRDAKLPAQRLSLSTTTPPPPPPSWSGIPISSDSALSYSAAAATSPPADGPASVPVIGQEGGGGIGGASDYKQPLVAAAARRDYPLLRNSKGQRLDAIINPPQSLVKALSNVKICNEFHLLGECSYNSSQCRHEHGIPRLDGKSTEARRLLVRQQNPCPRGLRCDEEKCLKGHECPDKACAKGRKSSCRFPPEMHNVDRS